jgi:aryl-alcohol dehydrogenase-like predicted oxidoreductase
MKLRKLGNSDVYITPVVFGAWAIGGWMWGGNDRKDSLNALRESFELGITSFDTAPAYGFGLSEELIGEMIKGNRHKYQILTKYGLVWNEKKGQFFFSTRDNEELQKDMYRYAGKGSIIKQCEESLKRLGTDYIDLYQIHWPDYSTPIEETMEAMNILLSQGKIRAAGVSNYDKASTEEAFRHAPICSNQAPYSMVNREIEKDLVPYCINKNIAILAYSPLQRGLLTGKFSSDHKFGDGDTRPGSQFYKPNNITRTNQFLDELKPLANEKNASLSQLVIRWTLEQPGITAALVGARNPEQTKENAGALRIELTKEEIKLINKSINSLILES